ncbi:TPA: glycosyltransferase family A protein [Klebsiella pneumoniae]|mgnify:FL=1|jgi:hypothetical protein|nr:MULTISPECIES: glycosyltransferase family A protein [Enterobacteriaceae]DAV81376.1 MAG TPA: hypothetical protein [Caudoviricetes sp.]HDU5067567.1 glycosyltransferase family 2 protein [Klebsiella pneumoniae subsp. pneumoniae]EKY0527376.1 glycosyltransferase family 2 protein [Klebsiella pneumoniae]MCL7665838.1 glycosyltransferase family 2 protein [Klebsiella pneumoniae]MCP5928963.1 glycosyltransferase family 2 protein [Klebsiella pneumoniae]
MEKILTIVRHKPGRFRFLLRALHSVYNQTSKEVKVAIYCMGAEQDLSKDEYSYINTIQEKYNLSLIPFNQDVSEIIKKSDCEYICFLDDDDTWAPEYLSRISSTLTATRLKYPSINAIACHSNKVVEVAERNRIIINTTSPWNHYLAVGPLSFDVIHYKNSLPISSCFFVKNSIFNIINKHNFSSPSFFWPFLIDYLSQNDLWILPEPLAFYHFRENTDFKYGNFTEINREECEIDYRLMINNMMRDSKNSTLLNTLLSNLTNSNMVYKLSNIENKLNERK